MVVAENGSEKAPNSLNERLVVFRLDGVVHEVSYAIITTGNKVDAPPDDRNRGSVHVTDPLERVAKSADLSCVVHGDFITRPQDLPVVTDCTGRGRDQGG